MKDALVHLKDEVRLWKKAENHDNILPLISVWTRLPATNCFPVLALPWCHDGNILNYLMSNGHNAPVFNRIGLVRSGPESAPLVCIFAALKLT